MFPDMERLPSQRCQFDVLSSVPFSGRGDLPAPPGCIRLWSDRVLGTSMPEASIYEDRQTKPHNDYVWPPRKISTMQPKTHTPPVQFAAESPLGPSVLATKPPHERTDLRGRSQWFRHHDYCLHPTL